MILYFIEIKSFLVFVDLNLNELEGALDLG